MWLGPLGRELEGLALRGVELEVAGMAVLGKGAPGMVCFQMRKHSNTSYT